jgi:hypothetical protein
VELSDKGFAEVWLIPAGTNESAVSECAALATVIQHTSKGNAITPWKREKAGCGSWEREEAGCGNFCSQIPGVPSRWYSRSTIREVLREYHQGGTPGVSNFKLPEYHQDGTPGELPEYLPGDIIMPRANDV